MSLGTSTVLSMKDNKEMSDIKRKMLESLEDDNDETLKKKFMKLLRTDLRTR
jgi:hypothetical protein